MAMARTLTKAGRKPNDEPLADQGCFLSATCAGCWLRECVYVMPPADRKVVRLAWRALEEFRAQPDGVIA